MANVQPYQLLQWRGALHIQKVTGLKHSRGSVVKVVAKTLRVKVATVDAALKLVEDHIEAQFGPLMHRYTERDDPTADVPMHGCDRYGSIE